MEDTTLDKTGGLDALTAILGLDEFEVTDFVHDVAGKRVRFTVIPKVNEGLCPHCRTLCRNRHSTLVHEVLDLPMSGCATELLVRTPQFRCRRCGRRIRRT